MYLWENRWKKKPQQIHLCIHIEFSIIGLLVFLHTKMQKLIWLLLFFFGLELIKIWMFLTVNNLKFNSLRFYANRSDANFAFFGYQFECQTNVYTLLSLRNTKLQWMANEMDCMIWFVWSKMWIICLELQITFSKLKSLNEMRFFVLFFAMVCLYLYWKKKTFWMFAFQI
jgi:hypothetical protein